MGRMAASLKQDLEEAEEILRNSSPDVGEV